MRYALSLPIGGECADPRILAEFAQVAEAAGWDAVLLEDYITYTNDNYHSLPGHPTHDPWIALAAMATRTETIGLGTCVTRSLPLASLASGPGDGNAGSPLGWPADTRRWPW